MFVLLLGPACTISNTCLISVKNKRKQKIFFGFVGFGVFLFFGFFAILNYAGFVAQVVLWRF